MKKRVNKTDEFSNVQFETFRKIGINEVDDLKDESPSCFTGNVRFKKFKVTVSLIEEPVEVYQQRLQQMWDKCDNHHQIAPLREAAESIGYEFVNNFGSKRKSVN